MKRAIYALLALADLHEILEFAAKDKPRAAVELVDRIEERCLLLANNPGLGTRRPEFPGDVRSFPVGNYVIYYRPRENGIEVLRVIHGARERHSLS